MKKNKYIYHYKDITIRIYASNKGLARYYVNQLYYYIEVGMYKFWDESINGNNKIKFYCLNFEDYGYNAMIKINSTSFISAMRKLNKLYKLLVESNKKVEEIMGLEVIKDE